MAKLLSTKGAARYVPLDQRDLPEGEQVTYLLRVPGPYCKAKIDRAIRAAGARPVSYIELLQMQHRGVTEIFEAAEDGTSETRDRFLAAIEGLRDRMLEEDDLGKRMALVNTAAPEVNHAADVLRREYPPYAALEADQAFYLEATVLETVRHSLVGWEGLEAAFKSGPQGASDASLTVVQGEHPDHLTEIWAEFRRLQQPTEEEVKNSGSSSPSGDGPTTSTSAATSSSTPRKTPGKKTSGRSRK